MKSKSGKFAIALMVLLFLAGIAQWYHFYPLLPESVADHFNTNGFPDSWSSKSFFLFMDITLSLCLLFIFIGGSRLPFRLPKNVLNIPNPDHWLKDDLQVETVVKISNYVLWIGVLSMLFVRTRFHHIYQINSEGPPFISNFFWLWFFVYVAVVIGFTWKFYSTFNFETKEILAEG